MLTLCHKLPHSPVKGGSKLPADSFMNLVIHFPTKIHQELTLILHDNNPKTKQPEYISLFKFSVWDHLICVPLE